MKVPNRCSIPLIAFAFACIVFLLTTDAESSRETNSRHKAKRQHHSEAHKVFGTKKVRLLSNTEVQLPKNFRLHKPLQLTFYGTDFKLAAFSRSFAWGEAVWCEVVPSPEVRNSLSVEIAFEDQKIPLAKKPWGYAGIFAIPPDSKNVWANINVTVRYEVKKEEYHFPLQITQVQFPVYKKAMQLGEYSDADVFKKKPWLKERIENEMAKKKKIFSNISPYEFLAQLSHPRDYHKITSSFYARRLYERYEVENEKKIILQAMVSPHLGLDLWGPIGAPVYTMMDGTVVLAEEMFYEGNQVIIDHGGGVFSRYMHLSEILVRVGDAVRAGKLIGKVGASGMVTGPHLHAGVVIRGVYVDPMSLLYLPVR